MQDPEYCRFLDDAVYQEKRRGNPHGIRWALPARRCLRPCRAVPHSAVASWTAGLSLLGGTRRRRALRRCHCCREHLPAGLLAWKVAEVAGGPSRTPALQAALPCG